MVSNLVPPDNPPHRPYFGKPRDPNALPFSCRWVLRLGVHVLVLAAPFAAHSAPDQLSLKVPEDFPQVTRQVPPFDVTKATADEHELPDLMGIAELPFPAALSSSTSIRHDPK
jgi:hypothetical protein